MNKEQILASAALHGVKVTETTYGMFNPEPVYSFEPVNSNRFPYRESMYHVSCNRSRSELVSGVRLMAERMNVELKGFPAK